MKRRIYLIIAVLSTILIGAKAQILHTRVSQGEIAGEIFDGYALYRAIPYAEAPVGNLRWKKPVAKKPWSGIYTATKWGDMPMQSIDPNQAGDNQQMSEDCLYLSIQTPAQTVTDSLPVFVMIHGGGFATGTYAGTQESFVKQGIVWVSIEYRLGAFGFMAHPELDKESDTGTSGNYGIYDQICALQWVHDNIAAFGGDPNKVTICGESAGGISVSILCASPLTKGLFRGAISESGGNFCPQSGSSFCAYTKPFQQAEQEGINLQKALGARNLKAMRRTKAEEVAIHSHWEQFWPVVDGIAITGDQYRLYQNGAFNDVNVLIGYNSDEGSLFMRQMDMNGYHQMTGQIFGSDSIAARAAYPATNDKEALFAIQDIFRDNAFGWPTWAWANLQSEHGKGDVYMYYFAQSSQNSFIKDSRGATHVAEMPFIYGANWGPMTPTDQHIAAIMEQYWVNFIKTGNPNQTGLPYWTQYKKNQPTVMYMRNGLYLDIAPNEEQMLFWENHFIK